MEWGIYFVGVVDELRWMLGTIAFFALIAVVISSVAFVCASAQIHIAKAKCFLKIAVSAAFISALLCAFAPSSKTLASMYVLPAIAKNEQLQNFAGNSLKALELLSKQWVKDLTPSDESHI